MKTHLLHWADGLAGDVLRVIQSRKCHASTLFWTGARSWMLYANFALAVMR